MLFPPLATFLTPYLLQRFAQMSLSKWGLLSLPYLKYQSSTSTGELFIPSLLLCFVSFIIIIIWHKFRIYLLSISLLDYKLHDGRNLLLSSALSLRLRAVSFSCSYTLPAHLGRCPNRGRFEGPTVVDNCPSPQSLFFYVLFRVFMSFLFVLPLASCVNLNKLLTFSEVQLPRRSNGVYWYLAHAIVVQIKWEVCKAHSRHLDGGCCCCCWWWWF